jgi:glyoxylase-like metal-dependent hydrolase (beta-lactamase superfamily II)
MLEITSGIFRLEIPIPNNPLGCLNCYLVEGSTGWLMVDAGWNSPDVFRSLEAGLKEVGVKLTDLASVVITHGHIDHIGLVGRIKNASPGTKIMFHQWEAQMMDYRYLTLDDLIGDMRAFLGRHGVPSPVLSRMDTDSVQFRQLRTSVVPDRPLFGGEILSTGVYDLEIIWTPGHSPGHVCLYEPKKKILFSGDHVLPTITPNIGYHVQSSDNPLGDYLYSLQKLRFLPVAKILPAHGEVFSDLVARLDQMAEHHMRRKQEILDAISDGNTGAYDISANIVWGMGGLPWDQFPPIQQRAAMMETIAHLECLRWEGKVSRAIVGGMFRYEGA